MPPQANRSRRKILCPMVQLRTVLTPIARARAPTLTQRAGRLRVVATLTANKRPPAHETSFAVPTDHGAMPRQASRFRMETLCPVAHIRTVLTPIARARAPTLTQGAGRLRVTATLTANK